MPQGKRVLPRDGATIRARVKNSFSEGLSDVREQAASDVKTGCPWQRELLTQAPRKE